MKIIFLQYVELKPYYILYQPFSNNIPTKSITMNKVTNISVFINKKTLCNYFMPIFMTPDNINIL